MSKNRITITLPLDGVWLPFVRNNLQLYAEMVGFTPRVEKMCTESVLEACDELLRVAKEAGVSEPISLHFDYKGETSVFDMEYDARIPLNPHEVEEYEVPDANTDLYTLNTSTLWLHLIKRQMDRVRFKIKGSRRILRMVKYRRDEGKEKQAWVMSIKPELRKNLLLHLSDEESEYPSSTLQATGVGVLNLGPSETYIVRNMDGKKSFHELYMAHIDALGLISPATLANLYEELEKMGMLASQEGGAKNTLFHRVLKKIISFDYSIPNADAVTTAVHGRSKFLYSSLGFSMLLAVGISGFIPFWEHFARFREVITGVEEDFLTEPALLLPLYILTLVHIVLHELGHGVTCKHFGGKVPRMGIMFYLAAFIFYCDTTAAWSFPEKRHRILVSLGGPIMSFAVLGASLWTAGYFAGTDSDWETVLVLFSLFNLFSLIMNFNPFIKMDAYYILVDYTGIPNLRARSFKFLERKLFGWLGLGSDENTKVTFHERRIFWLYGISGGFVTLAFIAIPVLRLDHLLRTESVWGGKMFFALLIGALLVGRIGQVAFSKIKAVRYREYKIQ